MQLKFAKYILGVYKSATNIAVLGEFGVYPLSLTAFKCIFSKSKLISSIVNKLEERFKNYWEGLLYTDDKNVGGNKLRTYRNVKTNDCREEYLFTDIEKKALQFLLKYDRAIIVTYILKEVDISKWQ